VLIRVLEVEGNKVVLHGEAGFLVPSKDAKALAWARVHLMELPERERNKDGGSCQGTYREKLRPRSDRRSVGNSLSTTISLCFPQDGKARLWFYSRQ